MGEIDLLLAAFAEELLDLITAIGERGGYRSSGWKRFGGRWSSGCDSRNRYRSQRLAALIAEGTIRKIGVPAFGAYRFEPQRLPALSNRMQTLSGS
jgi:hypothetical protein